MFIIKLTYIKPLAVVDEYMTAHRQYLDKYYAEGILLVSGPQLPRTGGIIIATINDRAKIQQIIQQDPYFIHDIAAYELIEFTPVKFQPLLNPVIENTIT